MLKNFVFLAVVCFLVFFATAFFVPECFSHFTGDDHDPGDHDRSLVQPGIFHSHADGGGDHSNYTENGKEYSVLDTSHSRVKNNQLLEPTDRHFHRVELIDTDDGDDDDDDDDEEEDPEEEEPILPSNSPRKHSDCYEDGAEHFHRVDESGFAHGVNHSGLSLVGGVFTEIHTHPACEDETPEKPKPQPPILPTGDDDDRTDDEGTDDEVSDPRYFHIDGLTPAKSLQKAVILKNILRITHVSFSEVQARGGRQSHPTLKIELTAFTPNTSHNGLVLMVDGQAYITPPNAFGSNLLLKGEVRCLALSSRPRNSAVLLHVKSPRMNHFYSTTQAVWVKLERFDITDFSISIRDSVGTVDRDRVTQTSFGADGNRIGLVRGAPSQPKRKLATMWASLKKEKK